MRKLSPLRSGAFRFAFMVAAVFAIGAVALSIMVTLAVSQYATEVASDSVSAEVAVLRDEARSSGKAQIIESVVRRENAVREHQLRYLLVDSGGHYLAGSLPVAAARVGWHNLGLTDHASEDGNGSEPVTLMALGTRLPNGNLLVVANDTSDLDELRQGLAAFAATFGIAITLLSLIGGYIVGRLFLRRLDLVNRSVERIMQGNFTERLPAIGMSAEFDHLSANLNRMLDRIEALMEGMRQVSTDIAHDLRTPLTRLRQRLEEMGESLKGTVNEDQINSALAQIDQILGVFRSLLRISSLEAGSGQLRIAKIDLSALMQELFDAYRPVAEDDEHDFISAIEPRVFGHADAGMLAQAVTNLIENAILHTPRGCKITVGITCRADGIAIIVADNGPGIPEAEREQVLRRFHRLDRSRGTPGAGLGLALVSAVAAVLGAKLRLLDNGPGLRAELLLAVPRSSPA